MEAMVVSEVYDTSWSEVSLVEIYESPVVVCTVKYDTGIQLLPAVVRMRNVGSTSFDIRLYNPKGESFEESFRDVHCLVVEEGSWRMLDNRTIEARKYTSKVTDNKSQWDGEQQTYLNSYDDPIVLGQVMSSNDDQWSVFWSRGSTREVAPDKDALFTGKHVGADTDTTRDYETIGYIVIEAGYAISADIGILAKRGGDTAKGYVQGSHTYSFNELFATAPEVAVLSQVAIKAGDGDGSWAVLGDITADHLAVAVDEDRIGDEERTISNSEQLDYVVFSVAGVIQLIAPTPSMESMVVTKVKMSNNLWAKVDLTETYWSPIAVCTIKYDTGTDLLPGVVRMKNVLSESFEIRISNPKGFSSEDELRDVHCVVVEQGSWRMPDLRKIEANKYLSTVTDYGNQPIIDTTPERPSSWVGERRPYANSYYYEAPIVLGQVMTYNDATWCVFWCHGLGGREVPPDKEYLYTGKHVGQSYDVEHGDETIGYIVIEEGHFLSDGIEIETARGGNIEKGYVEGTTTYLFDFPFTTTPVVSTFINSGPPEVAVLSQSTMGSPNGAWAVLAEITSNGSMKVAVDEDQVFNDERNQSNTYGNPEIVDYIVFGRAGVVQLFPPGFVFPPPVFETCPAGHAFAPISGGEGVTRLSISNVDDGTELVDLGFAFKWLGGDTTVSQVRVSDNGQINIDANDSDDNCCSAVRIGEYGRPRIAVAQEDFYPAVRGDVATFVKAGHGSIVISWEDVAFYFNSGNANAQAELFENGAVNICYGEGDNAGNSFAAGMEGGGPNDPYWNRDAVALPLGDEHFNSDGITTSWPTNKCYCYNPVKLPPPPPSIEDLNIGCYKDSNDRDLVVQVAENGASIESCLNQCLDGGYLYAGVQDGRQCFCGNTFGKHGFAPPPGCNLPCSSGGGICGGSWANNVYDLSTGSIPLN
jgi:hypothetical protein